MAWRVPFTVNNPNARLNTIDAHLQLQPLFGYISAMPKEHVSSEVCKMIGCSKATLSKICRDDPPLGRMHGVQRFFTDAEVKSLRKRFKGKAGRPRKGAK
jgi:hypothetical protein